MQEGKPLLAVPASHIRMPVQIPASPLVFQLHGKAVECGLSAWTPVIYLGDSDGTPGPWLRAGPAQTTQSLFLSNI